MNKNIRASMLLAVLLFCCAGQAGEGALSYMIMQGKYKEALHALIAEKIKPQRDELIAIRTTMLLLIAQEITHVVKNRSMTDGVLENAWLAPAVLLPIAIRNALFGSDGESKMDAVYNGGGMLIAAAIVYGLPRLFPLTKTEANATSPLLGVMRNFLDILDEKISLSH